jgi:branched-chain amino acid transport system ATP-binding protein
MNGDLVVDELHASYGAFEAVRGISLSITPGTITALFGHNGAGKTTTLRVIAGLKTATSGNVRFGDRDVAQLPASARARLGLALMPDGARGVFPTLSVGQNLELARAMSRSGDGAHGTSDESLLDELFGDVLRGRAKQRASSLSGGERQMLALCLAVVRRPAWLLLDEPALGLAPKAVGRLMSAIGALPQRLGMAILIVEQGIGPVLKIADTVTIMKSGSLVTSMPAAACPPPQDLWRYF